MKILNVISSLDKSFGGPARSVPNLCMGLSNIGIETRIISRKSANPVKYEKNENFDVFFISYLQVFNINKILKNYNPDIIHLQHIWDPFIHFFAAYASKNKIPYVISIRGMLEPWIMAQRSYKKYIGLKLYQRKDIDNSVCIHATSNMELNSIRDLGFGRPVAIIPNSIVLPPESLTVKSYKKKKKMVFLSRLHKKKGLELLINAWNLTKTENWELKIAGEGDQDYVRHCKKLISDLELNNIEFVGGKYGNEKWEFLSSADVSILPSYSENFGMVVAESLAVGTPVITTKNTPWEELNTKNCGWWIDLKIQNLVEAINNVVDIDETELEKKGENGKRLIHGFYNTSSLSENMFKLYEWILRKNSEPSFINFG